MYRRNSINENNIITCFLLARARSPPVLTCAAKRTSIYIFYYSNFSDVYNHRSIISLYAFLYDWNHSCECLNNRLWLFSGQDNSTMREMGEENYKRSSFFCRGMHKYELKVTWLHESGIVQECGMKRVQNVSAKVTWSLYIIINSKIEKKMRLTFALYNRTVELSRTHCFTFSTCNLSNAKLYILILKSCEISLLNTYNQKQHKQDITNKINFLHIYV